jgi:hypothetical protein
MKKQLTIVVVTLSVLASLCLGQITANNSPVNSVKPATKSTNKLDHSKATVRISFNGLLALCINDNRQAEIGALRNVHHVLTVDVNKVSPTGVSLFHFPVSPDQDIWIEAVKPATDGVTTYVNDQVQFNRQQDTGDPEDFRWLIDLEGEELHNQKLAISKSEMLNPRLHISNATFYTEKKAVELSGRVTWDDDTRWVFLGRLAETLAADILLDNENSEVILRSGADSLRLKKEPGTRYEIAVRNTRSGAMDMGHTRDASDFQFWYDAFQDPSGKKYNLRHVVEYAGARGTVNILDGIPLACNPVFLSRTRKL